MFLVIFNVQKRLNEYYFLTKIIIHLFEPHVSSLEKKEVEKVLTSKFWALGSEVGKVSEFEEKFQKI